VKNASLGIDMTIENIDSDNMRTLLVGVFHPVGGRNLGPGVVEVVCGLEELHDVGVRERERKSESVAGVIVRDESDECREMNK